MKSYNVYSLLIPPVATVVAFSSIPADPFFNNRRPLDTKTDHADISRTSGNNTPRTSSSSSSSMVAADSVAPRRVAMDIGREPLARMPFDWARSGCRMPLVILSDFAQSSSGSGDKTSNLPLPHSKTVSVTGPDGAMVKPIEGEEWELSKDSKELTFSYTVPEELTRRDVTISAGTELVCSGRVYTQAELDHLNQDYYQAREELWQAGGDLGDIYDRQGASKKWDEESGQWIKRYPNENPFKIAQKQLSYWGAQAKQGQKMSQRPDLNLISDRGSLPGVEGGIYVAKGGVVRAGPNGPVCGTWSAMPITGAPASYR